MSLFLTADELHELTGYTRPKYQAIWLRENGYSFELDRHNHPKVLRQSLFARSGLKPTKTEPDFDMVQ